MAEKQAHLNGAYYGPAIPPPTQNYHRPSRSGCGCGCCLLSFLLKLIITVVVIIGLAVLIFWLIFRPNKVKFHVTDATLTQFDYNTTNGNNLLYYNLAVNLTIRNPNKRIGIYYDRIEVRGVYEDEGFNSQYLTPFYQGHKNTTDLSVNLSGQNVVVLTGEELTNYNQEKGTGTYSIDVNLYLKIRLRFGKIRVGKFKPKVKCELKVPLSNGSSTGSFQRTRCDVDYRP